MYTARYSTPRWIERAKTQTLDLPIYHNGSIVVISSGTLTLYDAQGTALVNASAVTISNSIATYSLSSSVVPASMDLGENWIEVWTLVDTGGQVHTFQRDAALVRRVLYPVITDADLLRRHTNLSDLMISNTSVSLQKYIDEAWDTIFLRLMEDGRYPYLILSPWSMRAVHVYMSLHLTFMDATTYMDGSSYEKLAETYAKMYEQAWSTLKFTYDMDKSGLPSQDEQGSAATPIIYLGGAPSSRYYDGVE